MMTKNPPGMVVLLIAIGVLVGVGAYTFGYGRGYSYLLDDPEACVNCHIMRDSYDSWRLSSHRSVTCNDCHTPHGVVGKYAAKLENGLRHSSAFTFENVQVPHTSSKSLHTIEQNCVRCHESMISFMLRDDGAAIACTRCHPTGGHIF